MLHRFLLLLAVVTASSRMNVISAQFVTSPVSTIAYLGDQASFSCTTNGNHLLVWSVNGIEARLPQVHNRGISFVHFGINSEMSNLTALASIQNNNSEIICIQENLITGQEIARTQAAYLYVQGLLEAPTNATVVFRNETIIRLTWLPPFSLKNILGYSIIITSENDIETRNTTLHNFTYTWEPSFGYCSTFIFQIAAVNVLGMGNTTRGITVGFLRPFIEDNPSNKTARIGEWTNFTCSVYCSLSEYLAWFVRVNGSILPLFEGVVSGLKIKNYPGGSSVCSTSRMLKQEIHTVALMLGRDLDLDLPLVVYCALISVCNKDMLDCTTYSCYSQNANMDIEGTKILSTLPWSINTSDRDIQLLMTTAGHNADENSKLLQAYNISFGTALGLGVILLLTVIAVVITVIINVLSSQRKKNKLQHPDEERNVVYDVVLPAVTIQPGTNIVPKLDSSIAPTTLQYCPAYQTSSCVRRS